MEKFGLGNREHMGGGQVNSSIILSSLDSTGCGFRQYNRQQYNDNKKHKMILDDDQVMILIAKDDDDDEW